MNPKKPFREIFKGLKPKAFVIPLPYFNPQRAQGCLDCVGGCVSACPEHIIVKKEATHPYLDFKERGCTFCGECAQVCAQEHAGVLEREHSSVIGAWALIDSQTCLSYQGVVCFACKDTCPYNAISFEGMFFPHIHASCTGCGMCAPVCPSQAILFVERKT
ncbi:4Fe-4S dicluster domain-containing protein [Helicobacter baculiformis]|uniref:4Fe-4S dicluster domain-containing protein n=1 Tax=Helicobacter baculiformis TaxID=427351 RepID=A0ABV7ZF92_9HELI|nr:4Fe-4S dicluster domain-containing protein [Helicobacter baculiformis]